jgi:hypothetical protein
MLYAKMLHTDKKKEPASDWDYVVKYTLKTLQVLHLLLDDFKLWKFVVQRENLGEICSLHRSQHLPDRRETVTWR